MDKIKVNNKQPIICRGLKIPVHGIYGGIPITVAVPYLDDDGIEHPGIKNYNFEFAITRHGGDDYKKQPFELHLYHPKSGTWYVPDMSKIGISRIDLRYRMAVKKLLLYLGKYIEKNHIPATIHEKSNREKKREAWAETLEIRKCGPHEKKSQINGGGMVYRGVPSYATNPNVTSDGGWCGVAPAKTMPKGVKIKQNKPERDIITIKVKEYKKPYRHDGNSMAKVLKDGKVIFTTNYNHALDMVKKDNNLTLIEVK